MKLSADMQRVVLEQRLGYVATVCSDGTANLSPKGTVTVWDDEHLFFADLRSPQTIANLRANPSVEVNVVDVMARRGYRFKGTATIHDDDDVYRRGLELLRERGYAAYEERVHAIVLIRVERAAELTSPAYDLPDADEAEIRRHYEDYYVTVSRRYDSR
jgi:hypothetical protein